MRLSGTEVKAMIEKFQNPLKTLLRVMNSKEISFEDANKALRLLKQIQDTPPPDRARIDDPNIHVLLDTIEDVYSHFTPGFLASYKPVLDILTGSPITKLAYDGFWYDVFEYCLWRISQRWNFKGHVRPSSTLWNNIKPDQRQRLVNSITSNYQLLQERLDVINSKLDGEEAETHRKSRFEQFINRILDAFEREVERWQ